MPLQADRQCVWTGGNDQEHADTQQATTAGTPTQAGSAEQLSLQEQVRALQKQLAASNAEVAALKKGESSATHPVGESSRTPVPRPSPPVQQKKVPSVQPALGAFWKMPMTKNIGASHYLQPCTDADRGTVKVCGQQKEMAIPSIPTGTGPLQIGRCPFPLCQMKDINFDRVLV